MYQNIKYFTGLNALRFFAAYLVVVHHAEQVRKDEGLFHLKDYTFSNSGGIAVSFFFVLSGFLISYLLMRERQQTNDISIKKFYMRRVLRIWPLYFLLVFIGTVAIPFALQLIQFPYEMPYTFSQVFWYYLFFTPFMVNIFFGHHLLEPLWSIGVEELFYIMWAPLFKFLKNHILKIIFSVILIKSFLLLMANYFEWNTDLIRVLNMIKFEAMAIGGLAAYIIYHRKEDIAKHILLSKPIQWIVFSFIILRFFASRYLIQNTLFFDYLFDTLIISDLILFSVFAWLIVNISINTGSILKLNHRFLHFLGEISYGIYMYHLIIVFATVLLLKNFLNQFNPVVSTIIYYGILSLIVILTSYLSKVLFENQFLKLKKKFS